MNIAKEILQLVTFRIGEETFGASINKVQEVIRPDTIVKIPQSPAFVDGVINLSDNVIPIVDLRHRIGIGSGGGAEDKSARIVITEIGEVLVGLKVDSVSEVLSIDRDVCEKPPALVSGIRQKFISGLVKRQERMLIVLDLEHLFSNEEVEILKQA